MNWHFGGSSASSSASFSVHSKLWMLNIFEKTPKSHWFSGRICQFFRNVNKLRASIPYLFLDFALMFFNLQVGQKTWSLTTKCEALFNFKIVLSFLECNKIQLLKLLKLYVLSSNSKVNFRVRKIKVSISKCQIRNLIGIIRSCIKNKTDKFVNWKCVPFSRIFSNFQSVKRVDFKLFSHPKKPIFKV